MLHRIGLFGGTFDPVHVGHRALVNSFLNSGKIDELWIILSPDPPHKADVNPTEFLHRFKMLHLAFDNFDKIQILSIENKLPKPSYTYRTIQFLRKKYPDQSFYYCMGEDSLANFHSWKKPETILKETDLLVAHRPGAEHKNVDEYTLRKSDFVDHVPIDISSTQIKAAITRNNSIAGLVDTKVETYIRTHKLYLSN